MLSERFQCPLQLQQWYWLYVLIAMDEQCGSGMTGSLIIDRYGDVGLRVKDDVV
jgi:hypothetical protein